MYLQFNRTSARPKHSRDTVFLVQGYARREKTIQLRPATDCDQQCVPILLDGAKKTVSQGENE